MYVYVEVPFFKHQSQLRFVIRNLRTSVVQRFDYQSKVAEGSECLQRKKKIRM